MYGTGKWIVNYLFLFFFPASRALAASSGFSAASLARLALIPTKRASARALRMAEKAEKAFSSSVGSRRFSRLAGCLIGNNSPTSCEAILTSSAVESPFHGFLEFNGNRINFDLYSLSRCTFCWSESNDLLFLRWSTEIPIVLAKCLLRPARFSSSRVNPRPGLTLVWYFTVGQRTTGRRGPAAGRGAALRAFLIRLTFRRAFRAGWLNHVFT